MKITHTRMNPSGIPTTSSVPFDEDEWWDHPVLHVVFSYTSWTAQILDAFGHPRMKQWHKRVFERGLPKRLPIFKAKTDGRVFYSVMRTAKPMPIRKPVLVHHSFEKTGAYVGVTAPRTQVIVGAKWKKD